MTLKFNRVLKVVVFVQNFINLSTTVDDLSCWQRKNSAENYTAVAMAGSKYPTGRYQWLRFLSVPKTFLFLHNWPSCYWIRTIRRL